MNPKLASLATALACACLPVWAQTAPKPAPAAAPTERGEPNVKYTVLEDGGSKIEELNVRGQVQHVVVTPKVGVTTPYEIVTAPAGRDPFDGTGGARTSVGKRVWNVLKF
ncbi:MAG: DUF2782 domain-containing protein [Burkholderiales bacterium]